MPTRQLQGHQSAEPILETLNPTITIDPGKVLARMTYHHPIYSVQAIDAQRRYAEISAQRIEMARQAPAGAQHDAAGHVFLHDLDLAEVAVHLAHVRIERRAVEAPGY